MSERPARCMNDRALTLLTAIACALAIALSLADASARGRAALARDGAPSPVIFAPQRLTVRFDHAKHAALGVPCAACHDRASRSRKSADNLLPSPARCDACHGTDHTNTNAVRADAAQPLARCATCHVGYRDEDGNRVERTLLPKPNLTFSHALHVGRKIACATCHRGVERAGLATREHLPSMRTCTSCHRLDAVKPAPSGACTTCHVREGSRIKTRFGSGTLLPPRWLNDSEHGPDWLFRHRVVAGQDSEFCANCHREKDCADCHDGRVRPRRVHPNDYLSLHPVAARQNSPRCTSCHQEQNFCVPCHQRSGVAESGPFANFAQRGRFHPPPEIWTNGPPSARHHGWQAQRNLNACTSCHVERDCARCHATSAMGGGGLAAGGRLDPHPPGFRSQCARPLRQNPRPCLFCHAPADPVLAECR